MNILNKIGNEIKYANAIQFKGQASINQLQRKQQKTGLS